MPDRSVLTVRADMMSTNATGLVAALIRRVQGGSPRVGDRVMVRDAMSPEEFSSRVASIDEEIGRIFLEVDWEHEGLFNIQAAMSESPKWWPARTLRSVTSSGNRFSPGAKPPVLAAH